MFAALERSGSAPLCVYCTRARNEHPVTQARSEQMQTELRKHLHRIRTLRSNDARVYLFCRILLQASAPILQTLSLTWTQIWNNSTAVGPLGDFPQIRTLDAAWWMPSPGLSWLGGLKELSLAPLYELNGESSEDLFVEMLPAYPSKISLPHLKELDLEFDREMFALDFFQKLDAPQCGRSRLSICAAFLYLNQSVADYCNFLLGVVDEAILPPPVTEATISITYKHIGRHMLLTYDTGHRQLAFDCKSSVEEGRAFHYMVQGFQAQFKEPSLTVDIFNPWAATRWFLGPLADQNVRILVLHGKPRVRAVLLTISDFQNDSWPFESLKSLVINNAALSVREITRLVGVRHRYLQAHSKRWLEEITLVNCLLLGGMRIAKAATQLAAIAASTKSDHTQIDRNPKAEPESDHEMDQRPNLTGSAFGNIAIEVVHYIFEFALNLDRVHDLGFPLKELHGHRRQLTAMRGVSSMWNDFLLSSPRYWCVINLSSNTSRTSAWLERSGSILPLCFFCTSSQPELLVFPSFRSQALLPELQKHVARLRTVRSDNPRMYFFFKSLLELSAPALETLSLTWNQPSSIGEPAGESFGDLPSMQILHAAGWIPLHELSWLGSLKELALDPLHRLDLMVFEVLLSCYSLERLTVRSAYNMTVELPTEPATIALPRLRELDLSLPTRRLTFHMFRRLDVSRCDRIRLSIPGSLLGDRNEALSDYTGFLLGPPQGAENPLRSPVTEATVEINFTPGKQLSYGTVHRQLVFNVPNRDEEEGAAFHEMVQEFQSALENPPPLKLVVANPSTSPSVKWFLGPFINDNVLSMDVYCKHEPARPVLAAVGSRSMVVPPGDLPISTSVDEEWPFASLKSLTIRDASLELRELTWLCEIREKHLVARSKRWLENITLVDCRILKGMSTVAAVEQLSSFGVTLDVVRWNDFTS
ncbi:hypothetical protein FRB90_004834 [Tulasnella sp. 427]|nr:hypothetical protein FRB90_004834 [Tulasnella sp. 427]